MKKLIFILTVLLFCSSNIAAQSAAVTGQPAPAFSLPGSKGETISLEQFKGKYVVLEWLNHGCPFVRKHYETGNMQSLQEKYTASGVVWLSVSSSAEGKEGYMTAEEAVKISAEKNSKATAVLLDPEGTVGKTYGAKVTPHMFIINPQGVLIYAGAIDDNNSTRKTSVAGAKNYVTQALDEAMAGKPVSTAETEAYGCSVKYKS